MFALRYPDLSTWLGIVGSLGIGVAEEDVFISPGASRVDRFY